MRRFQQLGWCALFVMAACAGGGDDGIPDGNDPLEAALAAECGNGVVGIGELCDSAIPAGFDGACPTSCNDGNSCTSERVLGSAAECDAVCEATPIESCASGDGCCPGECDSSSDDDCSTTCGDGVVQAGETCDGNCPDCDDGDACTDDESSGSAANCSLECLHTPVRTCAEGDGCCPANCNTTTDADCSPSCGNWTVDGNETCEQWTCPLGCADWNACTRDTRTGSSQTCDVVCQHEAVTECANNDGCCPAGCTAANDSNCTAVCGNGVVETTETCDGDCPASCDDGDDRTEDARHGSDEECNVVCENTRVINCTNDDGRCPWLFGCNANNDTDCEAKCLNFVIEPGETCDWDCPTFCTDRNACTRDTRVGSTWDCNVICAHEQITECSGLDGCCPAGCDANNDRNCAPVCGNGVVELQETCDGNCPQSCDDGNPSTADSQTGSVGTCDLACVHTAITACASGDGFCPAACTAPGDSDCPATCGNFRVDPDELCEKWTCPLFCSDGDSCTRDTRVGSSQQCNVLCVHEPITVCRNLDGCCPAGCDANNDSNCDPVCGNGTVEGEETCDGNCPSACNDGNPCTTDTRTGSPGTCDVVCTYEEIPDCPTPSDPPEEG